MACRNICERLQVTRKAFQLKQTPAGERRSPYVNHSFCYCQKCAVYFKVQKGIYSCLCCGVRLRFRNKGKPKYEKARERQERLNAAREY